MENIIVKIEMADQQNEMDCFYLELDEKGNYLDQSNGVTLQSWGNYLWNSEKNREVFNRPDFLQFLAEHEYDDSDILDNVAITVLKK